MAKPVRSARKTRRKSSPARAAAAPTTDQVQVAPAAAGIPGTLVEEPLAGAGEALQEPTKDAVTGEPLPPVAALPPAAGPCIIVTGPKNGRYRAGIRFGPEPVELSPDDFEPAEGEDAHRPIERLHAILTDPRLVCIERHEDGTEGPVDSEMVEQLEEAIQAGKQRTAKRSVSIMVSSEGASKDEIAALKDRLDQLQRDPPGTIVSAMRDARRRFLR